MFYSVNSSGLLGLSAYPVRAEVDFSQSMPAFEIVGLPGTAVKESRDRVRSAIRNCGFAFPVGKIIVNLSPADVKKDGALYDLPIFLGVLKAGGMLDADLADSAFSENCLYPARCGGSTARCRWCWAPKNRGCAGFPPAGQRFRGGAGSRNRGIWPVSRQTAAGLVSKRRSPFPGRQQYGFAK